jgi:hypothetical protein
MNITVIRKIFTEKSTIGELSVDGQWYCYTLELPWKENHRGISCIPEGAYTVVVDWSNSKKSWLPHVLDVPDRDGIRIHVGNYPSDIQGCILVGEGKTVDMVTNSRKVLGPLFEKLRTAKVATLTIQSDKPKEV